MSGGGGGGGGGGAEGYLEGSGGRARGLTVGWVCEGLLRFTFLFFIIFIPQPQDSPRGSPRCTMGQSPSRGPSSIKSPFPRRRPSNGLSPRPGQSPHQLGMNRLASSGVLRRDLPRRTSALHASHARTPRRRRSLPGPSGAPNASSDPIRLSFAPLCAARAPLRAGSWARSARAPGGRSKASRPPSVLF